MIACYFFAKKRKNLKNDEKRRRRRVKSHINVKKESGKAMNSSFPAFKSFFCGETLRTRSAASCRPRAAERSLARISQMTRCADIALAETCRNTGTNRRDLRSRYSRLIHAIRVFADVLLIIGNQLPLDFQRTLKRVLFDILSDYGGHSAQDTVLCPL